MAYQVTPRVAIGRHFRRRGAAAQALAGLHEYLGTADLSTVCVFAGSERQSGRSRSTVHPHLLSATLDALLYAGAAHIFLHWVRKSPQRRDLVGEMWGRDIEAISTEDQPLTKDKIGESAFFVSLIPAGATRGKDSPRTDPDLVVVDNFDGSPLFRIGGRNVRFVAAGTDLAAVDTVVHYVKGAQRSKSSEPLPHEIEVVGPLCPPHQGERWLQRDTAPDPHRAVGRQTHTRQA